MGMAQHVSSPIRLKQLTHVGYSVSRVVRRSLYTELCCCAIAMERLQVDVERVQIRIHREHSTCSRSYLDTGRSAVQQVHVILELYISALDSHHHHHCHHHHINGGLAPPF